MLEQVMNDNFCLAHHEKLWVTVLTMSPNQAAIGSNKHVKTHVYGNNRKFVKINTYLKNYEHVVQQ